MLRRLLLISDHLKTGRHFSCVSLGRELEVHARTIRRDLDFLRDECGAPLEWEPTTKTWFLNGHWEGFGSLRLDSAESLALILAEQSFRRVRHTPIATALHAILEKIAQSAGENLRHSWESLAKTVHPTGQTTAELREHEHFASIADAIRKKRVLRIHYLKPGEAEAQQRHIHPLGLAELDQRWVVIACDPNADGDGIRKFLLARMEHCRRLPETFSTPADFNLDTYLGGSVGLFTSDSIYTVEAEFSPYAAPYLREAPWHPSQKLQPLPNGRIHATWQVNHLIDIQRKLLSWGEHVTVLAPSDLITQFATIAEDFAQKYSKCRMADTPCPGAAARM